MSPKNYKNIAPNKSASHKVTQKSLAHMALTSKRLCFEAVPQIIDQDILADIAIKQSISTGCRKIIIDKLTNQKVLTEIAIKENDSGLRERAAKRITDQDILKILVLEDDSWHVRNAALSGITDQYFLTRLVMDDAPSNAGLKATAVRNLTDQNLLFQLALNDDDRGVREAATGMITDEKMLEEIFTGSSSSFPQGIDEIGLTNQKLLTKIIQSVK